MSLKAIDLHSHIYFSDYDDNRKEVLAHMKEHSIGTIVVGVDLETSKQAVAFAQEHENIFASIGLHPNNTKKELFNEKEFLELVKDENVVSIGECGLDYFRIDEDIEIAKERQREEFKKQIEFAIAHSKPLMLHCRPTRNSMDAYRDALALIESKKKEHGEKLRGNFHFFVGNIEISKQVFKLGFTVSFPGVITFADEYNDVVKNAPLSMIHAETDAPYAAPVPHRGKRNEPVYVLHTIEKIAELRDEPKEEIEQALLANAKRVFDIL